MEDFILKALPELVKQGGFALLAFLSIGLNIYLARKLVEIVRTMFTLGRQGIVTDTETANAIKKLTEAVDRQQPLINALLARGRR